MRSASWNRREFLGSGAWTAAFLLGNPSHAQSGEITDLTLAQASRLIRRRELSPQEIVRAYIERIDRVDGRLNAFITVTADRAVSSARQLETEIANGEWRGPLHGIPIALKDNIDTAGVLTTAGSAVYSDRVPEENAEVVTRLEAAGAIVLGKLNMHEFAYGASSAISDYGPVHNPWDLGRIPGGSSGGSGAAVAARLCAGALGTDTGGSIRIPAAYCGIVGFKPTYGLASIRGVVPLSPSFDHVGPMCRTVADAALMLQGIVGYDDRDVASIEAVIPRYAEAMQRRTSALRLGVPRAMFYEDVDPQILETVEAAIDLLGRLTGGLQEIELPAAPEALLVLPEAFAYHAPLIEERRSLYDPITLQRILRGADFPVTDYVEAKHRLELARKDITRVFQDVDLLVTPTLHRVPMRVEEAETSVTDEELIRNAVPFNAFGIPSISIPCGFTREGWPVGLQISGPPLGELDVLAAAHGYEQATDWHERQPVLE